MSVADLSVIGVVAVFFDFIVWANVHHRKRTLRKRKTAAVRSLHGRGDAGTKRS